MKPYLALLRRVLHEGQLQGSRAVLADGSKPDTLSLFGPQVEYDLTDGFPLVTTKHVPFRLVVAELLWFLSGSTSVKPLQRENVHIWDAWAGPDGDLGVTYGHTWRNFGGVDQVSNLVRDLREVAANPQASPARRMLLSAWNPAEMHLARGPVGCHTFAQFYVKNGWLSCKMYQRSADLFLGVPFNVACYALLTHMLAQATGLRAYRFIHSFGDAHVYANHLEQVREQVTRHPFPRPHLVLPLTLGDLSVADVAGLKTSDFSLVDYSHYPRLRGEVAV